MPNDEKTDEQKTDDLAEVRAGEETSANEVQNSPQPEQKPADDGTSRLKRFKHWYLSRKKISIPLTILVLLIVLAAVPWSRYQLAGLAVKQNMTIEVFDSSSNTPVSGAEVKLGAASAQTDASGKAVLSVKAGTNTLAVTKKYYKDGQKTVLVPILKPKNDIKISLEATGRQVKVVVKNLISRQPLGDVQIDAAGTAAKTDKNGTATLVLPAGSSTAKATLSLEGYNNSSVTIQISNQTIKENDFTLTPAGKVYFLSNRTGKLSVMKSNLDGTGAEMVLEGTGNEDPDNTYFEVSPDQKYAALIAKRSVNDAGPQFYLISTTDDKLLTVDTGNASFASVGWYNDYFIYTVSRKYIKEWQPNAFSIKSYNAKTGQIISLVSTTATGTSTADAQYENIWDIELLGNNVVYAKTWYQYPGYLNVSGKQNVLAQIRPDGTGSKTLKSVDSQTSYISNLRLNNPGQLYFGIYSSSDSASTFYQLDKDGVVSQNSSISGNFFYGPATNYIVSPSRQNSLWDANRDGKTDILVADADGNNDKVIARFDPVFRAYGWYSDNYILISKNSSELYIMPRAGVSVQADLIKITDYKSSAAGGY